MTFQSTYEQRPAGLAGVSQRWPAEHSRSPPLRVLAFTTAPAMAQAAPTAITIEKSTPWGPILATSTGMTVYRFVKDATNKSNCSGSCTVAWPPVLLAKGQTKPVGKGVGHLGVIMRSNGSHQVTYEGIPL